MPLAFVALVMTGVAGATRIIRFPLPVPPEFVAERVMVVLPAADGVPVMAPVLAFKLKPTGRVVAAKLVGELLAVIW